MSIDVQPSDQLNRGHRIHLRYPNVGINGNADQVWQVDASGGPSFVDLTGAFNDTLSGNLAAFPAVEGVGDYMAIGVKASPFNHVQLEGFFGTVGTVAWDLHNGTSWIVATATGAGIGLTAPGPVDTPEVEREKMRPFTLNGVTAYWLRVRVVTVFTVNPVGDNGAIAQQSEWFNTDEIEPDTLALHVYGNFTATGVIHVEGTSRLVEEADNLRPLSPVILKSFDGVNMQSSSQAAFLRTPDTLPRWLRARVTAGGSRTAPSNINVDLTARRMR